MEKITLYHGTSDTHEDIPRKGLQNPYLTSSLSLAEYYAECAVDEVGGKEVIYQVQVDTSLLRYDGNAMDEPVSFEHWRISDLEEQVQRVYQKWTKEKPEWVSEKGYILIPVTAYQISLETVASCWYEGVVLPEQIYIAE